MSTADQVAGFAAIHRRTFDAFKYVPDPERWATAEYWAGKQDILAMAKTGHYDGDCDDMALIVRHECRQCDIPTRLVFCHVPGGGYHLAIECDGWISDCRYPHISRRDDLDYEWISLSGYNPGEPWRYAEGFDHTQPWPHERQT